MAEKRLIDADTLLETIHDTAEGLADCDQQNAAWALRKYAVRDIMDAPTVDAVEVVRCKDCEYRVLDWQGKFYYCSHPNGLSGKMDGTRYCDCGERRTDG